jgi:hypothetical protein
VFKARLIAKGCSQNPGTDFQETSSPTVNHESIHLALAVAATIDMELLYVNFTLPQHF